MMPFLSSGGPSPRTFPEDNGTGRSSSITTSIVVGSGFGGSVAALRLSEKGYRVAVLEAGRRFDAANLPRSSWDVRRFLWAPRLGCSASSACISCATSWCWPAPAWAAARSTTPILSTSRCPLFTTTRNGAGIADWRAELAPYYAQAKRMLGVVDNPALTPADEAMREVASEMGVAGTFRPAPVGVFFGPPGSTPGASLADPYFGGAGPARRSCLQCGECMTGCRHGAKNTLLTNYLHLAERAGAVVLPLTTVRSLEPRPGGGWSVGTVRTARFERGLVASPAGAAC